MMIAPRAPAAATFWTLTAKVQVPRSTSENRPAREAAGRAAQAWASPIVDASPSGTKRAGSGTGPAPSSEWNVFRPVTVRGFDQLWELVVAPTAIAAGECAGVVSEPQVGCTALPLKPSLPAAATTTIP